MPWTPRYVLEVSILAQKSRGGVRMTAASRREATHDYSKGERPSRAGFPGAQALRALLAIVGLGGVAALAAATSATIFEVTIVTTTENQAGIDTVQTGWERHGPSLILLAAFAVLMLAGALRGARPAMLAVAAAGLAALMIALIWDADGLNDVVGEVNALYEGATGSRKSGYYLETLGGALLLLSGGGLFLLAMLSPRERAARREAPDDRGSVPEGAG
jgi:hypothetical protein